VLAIIYPSLRRISTARKLIAPLIIGFSCVLCEATGASQAAYISGKALARPSDMGGGLPYAVDIANVAPDALRDSNPAAEGQGLGSFGSLYAEAGLDPDLKVPAVIGKAYEAAYFSLTSIAGSLGWVYDSQQHSQPAEARIMRLVSAAGNAFASRPAFAWALSNLAMIYKAQGRSEEAISLLERALAIASEAGRPDNYRLGMITNHLALYCAGEGRTADAEAYFKQAISAFEKSGYVGRASQAGALHNLAIFYGQERRYSEETEAALGALSLLTKEPTQDRSRVFDVLNTLGGAYNAQGRYKDAEPFLLRALAIARGNFESSDPRPSQITANLAVIYKAEGRFFESIVMFTRALKAAEAALGPEDVWVGMIANRLAVTYMEQGVDAEAELLFKRAIAIGEKSLGQDSLFLSAALFNLSALYARQQRYEEAEALLERSLRIRLHAYDSSHPAVKEARDALLSLEGALHEPGEQESQMTEKASSVPDNGER
jgi:tetratricopeptide (TPR) repeat protein